MYELAILGGGPAGLLCALAAARDRSVAVVLDERAAAPERQSLSVEAVPAALLALLREFGVTPGEVGADRLYRHRVSAWELATAVSTPSSTVAHLVRPQLETALLTRVLATPTITTFRSRRATTNFADDCWRGEGWSAAVLVDATGRRAVTAPRKIRPARPWVARLWVAAPPHPTDGAVQTVALRDGYAYRLGTARDVTVGLVGPAYQHVGSRDDLRDVLSEGDACWLIDGVSIRERSTVRVASVQWTPEDAHVALPLLRIGDAALARDALSSQGLATSLSDALCAIAALRTSNGLALFRARHRQQRRAHLRALIGYLASHRWSTSPVWREYAAWLGAAPPPNRREVVVRDAQLTISTLSSRQFVPDELF